MEVRCFICGKKEEIGEDHSDYERFELNPKATYFCDRCQQKLKNEAQEFTKPKQPIGREGIREDKI